MPLFGAKVRTLPRPGKCGKGASVGKGRALLPAAGSCGAILVAATAFLAGKGCEGFNRRAGAGMGIEAVAALGADAAPLAHQQGAAEQVGPDISMR